ncbi:MAG: LolA family protein [Blastocatellia bacterium]
MRKLIFGITLAACLAVSAFGQDAKAKAEEVLKQARAAIGSDAKFKAIQTLSAQGTSRQSFGQMQLESELELEFMMPDKIRISSISPQGTRIRAYNSGTTWNDFIPGVGGGGGFGGPPGGGGRGGGNVMTAGGPGGPGGANSPMATYMQQQQKREYIQILLAWFLAPPASTGTQFTYVGEAPGPEGSKLDVIDAKTSDGMATRLYFDKESHQLIGLSYKAKNMRAAFGGNRGPGAPGGQGGQQGQGGQRPPQATGQSQAPGQPGQAPGQAGQQGQRREQTPEEREKRAKEMAEAFEKAPDTDYRWAFSDYKNVGGLNLPHRLTKSEGGTPNEEWEISKYKANPKIGADKFEKKEKAPAPAN